MRRLLLLACAAMLALAAMGCTRAATPPAARVKPRPKAVVEVPVSEPSTADAQYADQLLQQRDPTFETTALPSFAEARRTFSGALFPQETFGRRLVAIVYRRAKATSFVSVDPREALTLVYERGLVIGEAWRRSGRFRYPYLPNATRETTTVGKVRGEVEYAISGEQVLEQATVRWNVGHVYYSISAPRLTKAQAVAIARSMAR